jgi:hypothetical protein
LPTCFDLGFVIRSEKWVVTVVDAGTGAVDSARAPLPANAPLSPSARQDSRHLVVSLRPPYEATILRDTA